MVDRGRLRAEQHQREEERERDGPGELEGVRQGDRPSLHPGTPRARVAEPPADDPGRRRPRHREGQPALEGRVHDGDQDQLPGPEIPVGQEREHDHRHHQELEGGGHVLGGDRAHEGAEGRLGREQEGGDHRHRGDHEDPLGERLDRALGEPRKDSARRSAGADRSRSSPTSRPAAAARPRETNGS
jgi:hypothetical protein